jgi:hypothetical protein
MECRSKVGQEDQESDTRGEWRRGERKALKKRVRCGLTCGGDMANKEKEACEHLL